MGVSMGQVADATRGTVGIEGGIIGFLRSHDVGKTSGRGTMVDGAGVCPLAQQEADGTDDDGFSGSGLACDDREAWMEIDVEMLDERVILYL